MVARLREGSYDAVRLPIERSLVSDILDGDPDVVIIGTCSVRMTWFGSVTTSAMRSTSRIIVVASGEPCPTAADASRDSFVVDVLDAGADDFVSSDMSVTSVGGATSRRRSGSTEHASDHPSVCCWVMCVIDAEAHILVVDGEVVRCPPLQFQLLVTLARRAGTLVSRETLFRELLGHPARIR